MSDPASSIAVEHTGIGQALEDHFFQVPRNQRDYIWEKDEVLDLLRDLRDAEGRQGEYFLGMVVLTKKPDGSLSIADGQQRLATTSILLGAIRDYLHSNNAAEFAQQIDSKFLQDSALGSLAKTAKLRLNATDNVFYENHVLKRGPVVGRLSASNERLMLAANLAAEHVKSLVATNSAGGGVEALMRTAKFIRDRATILLVTVANEKEAFRMFETLNDRGIEAAQSDLIKNHLVGLAETVDRDQEVLQRWDSMLTDLAALGQKEAVMRFLRHFYYVEYGHVRDHKLFAELSVRILGPTEAVAFADNLAESATWYAALWRPDDDRWQALGPTTRQHLAVLLLLRIDQLRPLHLAVARKFDLTEARKAFRLLVACAVRLAVGGGSKVGRIDREVAERAVRIGKEITTTSQLAQAMAAIVPSDAEFEPYFAVATTGRPELARYVLRGLELHKKKDPAPELVPNENQDSISIEHILPKHPGPGWNIDPDVAAGLVNRFGNMALLRSSTNKVIGNSSFAEKKKAFRNSTYALTSSVAMHATWGAKEINERQLKMAELAVETWPVSV